MDISTYILANTYSAFSPALNVGAAVCSVNGQTTACPEGLLTFLALFPIIFGALGLLMIVSFWKIFTKAGKPGWTSIIPVYNIIVLLEIVNKPTWWVILCLIPFVNIIIFFIIWHELAKSFGKGIGYTIGLIFLPLIFIPMLAFGNSVYTPPAGTAIGTRSWVVTVVLVFAVVLCGLAFAGVLSSIILASLNSARTKADDAAIRSKLLFFRADAELYLDKNGSYLGFCDSENIINLSADRRTMKAVCNDSSVAWAVSAPLSTSEYSCVDSTGVSYSQIKMPLGSNTSCSN